MIFCCGGNRKPDRIVFLNDKLVDGEKRFINRSLEILEICPSCFAKIAVLHEYRISDNKKMPEERRKNRRADKLITDCENEIYFDSLNIPNGSWSNLFWRYAIAKKDLIKKDLCRFDVMAVDFNGTEYDLDEAYFEEIKIKKT